MAAKKQQQAGDSTPIIAATFVLSMIGFGFLAYKNQPAFLSPLIGIMICGMLAQPPLLTGKNGEAANDDERKKLLQFQRQKKLSQVVLPIGYKPTVALSAAVGLGLIAASLLFVDRYGIGDVFAYSAVANGLSAFLLVSSLAAIWRSTASLDEPCPGTSLVWAVKNKPKFAAIALLTGALCGGPAYLFSPAHYVDKPLFLAVGVCLIVFSSVVWIASRKEALQPWKDREQARSVWRSRWLGVPKEDPAPVLINHETLDDIVIDTFQCQTQRFSHEYLDYKQAEKIGYAVGGGSKVYVLPVPNMDGSNQPQKGTINPNQFRVAVCPSNFDVDITEEDVDEHMVEFICERQMALAQEEFHAPLRTGVSGVEKLTQAGPAVWAIDLNAGLGEIEQSTIAFGQFGEVLVIDHRIVVGDFDNADWIDDSIVEQIDVLRLEAEWKAHFGEVLKMGATPPAAQLGFIDTQYVGRTNTEITRIPFAIPQGMNVEADFLPLGQRLSTTMPRAPFLHIFAVPPHEGRAEPGERSDKFFVVAYSEDTVPTTPSAIVESKKIGGMSVVDKRNGATLALAGIVDRAFRSIFKDRGAPQVIDALSMAEGTPAIWKIRLRLYGGVSMGDLRAKSDRLAALMRADWIRISQEDALAIIYVGALPSQANVKDRYKRLIAELDFEQAFVDAKVTTPAGLVPKMINMKPLEGNDAVTIYDFDLPPGITDSDVSAVRAKIAGATGNGFIQMIKQPSPNRVRLMLSVNNPVPERASFDFDKCKEVMQPFFDSGRGDKLLSPWGTGVDGKPVTWNFGDTPHVIVLGGTGTGKTVTLQAGMFAPLVAGWDIVVIDPSKGGADFTKFAPWLRGIIGTVEHADAMMKLIYSIVKERKNLNSQYGAANIDELPPEIRPNHVLIIIDEFTSLMLTEPVDRTKTSDPEVLAERELVEKTNANRASIGSSTARIAREARSAGVHLMLGTQVLKADTIAKIPGGDLKANLGRLLLGKTTHGEMMSGLKQPELAPNLSVYPKGRGIWESMSASAVEMQTWYADQDTYVEELVMNGVDIVDDWDYSMFLPKNVASVYSEVEEVTLDAIELDDDIFNEPLDFEDDDFFNEDIAPAEDTELNLPMPKSSEPVQFKPMAAPELVIDNDDFNNVEPPVIEHTELSVPTTQSPAQVSNEFVVDFDFDCELRKKRR
ncbi:FtsK/SpoIIIE domain-containing protein [Actinomyces vulturis]|uniref:FtsK/SpoIIIE domain-containing protein n=1 Tax=Actinomyces vulturis TaxID=1857645 RepID=UPI00082F9931|nr:FtsK/SpoIIIE domain-containing protein [Actinomyces vulturis]